MATALSCQGLTKRFKEVLAVDRLDLDVREGECFGLLGPNGAGKTTTVEILEGLTPPDAGRVEILGRAWGGSDDRALRELLGVALQETWLPEKLTVEETVRLFRSFYRKGRGIDEVIKLLDLDEKRKARVGKLSGGQRHRLALSCALVGSPKILFLDEPTTGLDPQARIRIWDVIDAFRGQGGTVLLTTHYMEEASRLCDRVAIMSKGRILVLDSPMSLVKSLGADEILEIQAGPDIEKTWLLAIPGILSADDRGATWRLHARDIAATLPAVFDAFSGRGIRIRSLATHQPTLEDVFVHLTGKTLADA